MIVIDSSAWIEFLRGTGSAVDRRVATLLDDPRVVTTEPVVMEVLAGARDARHLERLRALLARFELIGVAGLGDFETAASVYRTCRRGGDTPRSMVDCLIAAVTLRVGASVLHRDGDFDAIARHTALRVEAA